MGYSAETLGLPVRRTAYHQRDTTTHENRVDELTRRRVETSVGAKYISIEVLFHDCFLRKLAARFITHCAA